MAPLRSVSELASIIERHTKTLEDELKGTPGAFSLAFGALPQVSLNPPVEAIRGELLETIDELRVRLLGPMGYLLGVLLPTPSLFGIFQTLYSFDIASHVPLSAEAISYGDLAGRIGVPEDDTRRLLQAAIAFHIFEEVTPEESIRHNAVSSILSAPRMKDGLGLFVEEQFSGVAKLVQSLKRFPGSGEPGHSASVIALREEKFLKESGIASQEIADPTKNFFDYIAEDEKRVARFRSAMGLSTQSAAFSSSYFIKSLPWADRSQCPETVVDIAGAGGELAEAYLEVLRAYPSVKKVVVLDLPEVVAGAKAPEDLAGRLEYDCYNFLTEKMTRDADVYVFRHIFHDWSDQYGAKILKNLVPALKRGSKIWISEVVLPSLGDRNHVKDQMQRSADIFMKAGFNGKERSEHGWETLLAAADERFRIANITRPEGAHDSVIEIVFDA